MPPKKTLEKIPSEILILLRSGNLISGKRGKIVYRIRNHRQQFFAPRLAPERSKK